MIAVVYGLLAGAAVWLILMAIKHGRWQRGPDDDWGVDDWDDS